MAVLVKYRDLNLDFRIQDNGDIKDLNGEDAVKESVKNIVMTIKGEKFFDLNFGTLVNKLLFEPLDYAIVFRLKKQIIYALRSREPRIDDINVEILWNSGQNTLVAKIYYTIIGLGKRIDQTLTLERLR